LSLQRLTYTFYILQSYVLSLPSQQGPLNPAPADIGTTCSSVSLQTAVGIAACRVACEPAQCCQTDIGSANCGYAACGSYGECNALISVVDMDVSGEDGPSAGDGGMSSAGDGGNGGDAGDQGDEGDEGDAELVENGEMTKKPTGDGTFNDPEDGSLLDAVGNAGSTIEDAFKTATTDPSSLSTGQIVGIAVGLFVAFCVLICLVKCCCCRKK